MIKMYDTIIVGAGPGGYTAGIYAKRYGLDVLIIGEEPGGLCNEAHVVENWPGTKSIEGSELVENMREHVESLDVEVKEGRVFNIDREDDRFILESDDGEYEAKSVILAIGTEKRRLDIENEEKFRGKGVSYCTTCDAPLYKGKDVGVVGGRDSAAKSALLLAEHAENVYIIYRRDELKAEHTLKQRCLDNDKIEMVYEAVPEKLEGDEVLERVVLDNGEEMDLDGLFIEIGSVPNKVLMKIGDEKIEREEGYIKVDEDQSTNIPGVFAAGDVTTGSNKFRQIVTAAAEGSIAAVSAYTYVKEEKHKVQWGS
ncbi:MAG: NAD(P)/FAD-dependent oxidoreductase [Candidatus Aenigmatarchaeota archaeon]